MSSIIVDLGDSGDYSEEEYEECKRWKREISLLDYDGFGEYVSVDSFMSDKFIGNISDVVENFKVGDIGKCVRRRGEDKFCVHFSELKHAIRLANRILSPIGGKFLTPGVFFFVLTMASYIVTKNPNSTHIDLIGFLQGGQKVTHVSKVYTTNEPDRKMYIGTLSKLLGIFDVVNAKMDCPRVWDLFADDIVDNPNIGLVSDLRPIVAITHRWENGEATYADILEQKRTNAILQKIRQECQRFRVSKMGVKSCKYPDLTKLGAIRRELLEHDEATCVWMDTICIDKTSSVELDEAIRSMHRWYSNATFVYLEANTTVKDWSSRGWTLQEGAAAKSLVVSPKHGKSFMELLSNEYWNDDKVCGLALERLYMPYNSMYWINLIDSRKTTKKEDRAYALIGLLELDFQIAYGEGNRAMDRLYGELMKQKGDVTWLMGDKFRNGNWTNLAQTRDGVQYRVSMREICYKKNLVSTYEEIRIVGPVLRMNAVEICGEYLDRLKRTEINNGSTYGDTFDISHSYRILLEEIGSECKHWWVPSNNILLYLCRYMKGNAKNFWRIISVRGTPDEWIPPSLSHVSIEVDYNTSIYKSNFMDDSQLGDTDNMGSMGRNL